MKKLLFTALVAAFAFSLSSCGRGVDFESNELIGSWKMSHKYHWEGGDLVDDYVLHTERMVLHIKIDGSWAEESHSEGFPGTTESGRWELSGDKLRMTNDDGGGDEVWTIQELKFGRLVLVQGNNPNSNGYRKNTFLKVD